MKKIFSFSLIISLILVCVGCGNNDTIKIDSTTWEMTTVQATESGSVIAYNESIPNSDGLYENADVSQITVQAENGVFKLNDVTSGASYNGTYKVIKTGYEAIVYTISIDGKDGNAVTGLTKYDDGSQIPTLIITVDDYTINFQAKAE